MAPIVFQELKSIHEAAQTLLEIKSLQQQQVNKSLKRENECLKQENECLKQENESLKQENESLKQGEESLKQTKKLKNRQDAGPEMLAAK